jgi:hypothetical protein
MLLPGQFAILTGEDASAIVRVVCDLSDSPSWARCARSERLKDAIEKRGCGDLFDALAGFDGQETMGAVECLLDGKKDKDADDLD